MNHVELLKKRRDRSLAIILGVKEREVDPLLPNGRQGDRASKLMRKVVLDQMNDFYDFCLDVVGSTEAANMQYNPEIWEARLLRFDRFLDSVENGELSAEDLQEIMKAS